jgi:hypothetical protein
VLSDAQLAAENDTAWTGVFSGLSFSEDERWRFRHGAPISAAPKQFCATLAV